MESTNQTNNPETSDNPTASGSHHNSRVFGLVPGSNVISESQNRSNSNYQPVSEQHAHIDVALTAAGRPRQRRKWTNEINENLLRAYYIVTNQETNLTGYRTQLRTVFVEQHPDYDVSEQRLADQIRTIHRNNLIPEIRRNFIKESIIVQPTSHPQTQDSHATPNDDIDLEANYQIQGTEHVIQQTEIVDDQFGDIESDFQQQFEIYSTINPLMRPTIPKINSSRRLSLVIKYVDNEIIARRAPQINKLEDLHTLVYSAAVTIARKMGYKINFMRNNRISKEPKKNKTIQRIEINIKNLRSDLERINNYVAGNKTRRLKNKIQKIYQKYNRHSRYEINNSNAILIRDTIKQKLNVQIARQRKYKLSNKRRENNKKFDTNEKTFYRGLRKATPSNTEKDTYPNKEDTESYWSSIWSNQVRHNTEANWINEERRRYQQLEEMSANYLTCEEVKGIISKTHNWKSPGPDKLQNFWFKRLPAMHQKLTELLNECIQDPRRFPRDFTNGITYLLPKDKGFKGNPANGRPITCLPTIYKIMTACLNHLINNHLMQNNIICEEQKGCSKYAKGCKEQLTIDQIILEQTFSRSRNLNACYIDYRKAFDSVPHSWLIEVLKIYKINPNIIKFLTYNMRQWRTSIQIYTDTGMIKTSDISIKCGIFQGDCLSALWFCIALNPLSNLLKNSKYGYKIKGGSNQEILSHLLYMDDLKIYASTRQSLDHLIQIVSMFSKDITMKFGLEKCKRIHINKGKISRSEEDQNIENIEQMEERDVYKYLGMVQNRRIDKKTVKNNLTREFKSRIHKIAKANLNGKNLIKAINTYAVPVLSYSFGIIKWTVTEIQSLQRKIRTMLTDYKFHHPKSCCERMVASRRDGGRGLVDLQTLHDNQIESLRRYFELKSDRSRLIKIITEADTHLTPLNLNGSFNRQAEDKTSREQKWSIKAIHGRFYRSINADNVDKLMSNKWLLNGNLYAETEAFMIAIQDQVIPTKNYRKTVIKDPNVTNDTCRRCMSQTETIDHIISGCTNLAQTEYTRRHNNVVKILHKNLLSKYKFQADELPYYRYNPQPVMENEDAKIYYDRTIYSDHTRLHNRPDITILDKNERKCFFIDVAIPATRNMSRTYTEKISRYAELAVETKRNWNLTEIKIIPIIISAEGVIDKHLCTNMNIFGLRQSLVDTMQKSVIIDTCHITRNFMN